jgi:transmembrane sensor
MIMQANDASRPAREAADWYTRLSEPKIETDELEAFVRWRAIPENRAAYDGIEDLVHGLQALDGDPDVEAIVNEAFVSAPKGAPESIRRRSVRWRGIVSAAAAALIISLIAGGVTLRQPTYSTKTGETFSTVLTDGSRVQLNTDSAIRVHYRAGERRVELLRGQALFDVAHNPARPFIVSAGNTQTQALGTQFEVRRIGGTIRITLAKGSVQVTDKDAPQATWRLSPGQALAVSAQRPEQSRPVSVDVRTETSWTSGEVTFQDLPLADAVAELNRYSREKIILGDAAPRERVINGVFPTGDNSAFTSAVSKLYDLEVVNKPNGDIELQPRSRRAG